MTYVFGGTLSLTQSINQSMQEAGKSISLIFAPVIIFIRWRGGAIGRASAGTD